MKRNIAPLSHINIMNLFSKIINDLPSEEPVLGIIAKLLKIVNKEGLRCPRCGGIHYHSKGRYRKYFHRYTCNRCGRTFTDLTGTAFASIHKIDEMVAYFEQNFFQGTSVRKSGVAHNVNYKTIFYWRHKLAIALKSVAPEVVNEVAQLFEFTEKRNKKGNRHFPKRDYGDKKVTILKTFGQKNVVNLLTLDSANNITMQHVRFGWQMGQGEAEQILRHWLREDKSVVVLSGGALARAVARIRWRKRRVVEEVSAEERTECSAWRSVERGRQVRLVVKKWGRQFHGVATKYLDNYYATLIQIIEEKSLRNILIKILKNHGVAAAFKHQINIKVE